MSRSSQSVGRGQSTRGEASALKSFTFFFLMEQNEVLDGKHVENPIYSAVIIVVLYQF